VKIPRDLSGRELAKILCRNWGYVEVNQEGSHIILQTETPSRQRIPVPDHNPIRVGTLRFVTNYNVTPICTDLYPKIQLNVVAPVNGLWSQQSIRNQHPKPLTWENERYDYHI
jgi:predicted RNA binding protein YcfA (HicA-like mRNA interferase family)